MSVPPGNSERRALADQVAAVEDRLQRRRHHQLRRVRLVESPPELLHALQPLAEARLGERPGAAHLNRSASLSQRVASGSPASIAFLASSAARRAAAAAPAGSSVTRSASASAVWLGA